jgi:hypothetical protein
VVSGGEESHHDVAADVAASLGLSGNHGADRNVRAYTNYCNILNSVFEAMRLIFGVHGRHFQVEECRTQGLAGVIKVVECQFHMLKSFFAG